MIRTLKALAAVAVIALLAGGCDVWALPGDPVGNLTAEAHNDIGRQDPPFAAGGFWCYLFVNAVADGTIPGWVDLTGPNDVARNLRIDPAGPQPGDVVTFGTVNSDPNYAVHVGIVIEASPGDFASAEGNSVADPDGVALNWHPSSGPEMDGLHVIGFYSPA